MKHAILLFLAALFLFSVGFLLGHNYGMTNNQSNREVTPLPNPDFLSIEKCNVGDELLCFGSGRTAFMETENVIILNLVAKDGMLRYGLVNKKTAELYDLSIE